MTRLAACLGGCGQLISPGPRCFDCRRKQAETYDRTRPEHHALYRTQEWRRLSAEVRANATRCTYCLKPTRRLVADHIIPLDQRPDLALERSNLAPCCVPCNTRRARHAKLPDLDVPGMRRGLSLGDELAEIFEDADTHEHRAGHPGRPSSTGVLIPQEGSMTARNEGRASCSDTRRNLLVGPRP